MRQIKFRVWDKELQKMHICGEDVHDSMEFLDNHACYYNLQNGCGSLPKELDPDGKATYELMQYTGLKDKNGKEIYEGDIVRCYGGAYWNGVYEYDNVIEVKDIRYLEYIAYSEYVEILGNIYEHHELLEGE
jgi:uncharacterized phage protein (TIGR01671 family)